MFIKMIWLMQWARTNLVQITTDFQFLWNWSSKCDKLKRSFLRILLQTSIKLFMFRNRKMQNNNALYGFISITEYFTSILNKTSRTSGTKGVFLHQPSQIRNPMSRTGYKKFRDNFGTDQVKNIRSSFLFCLFLQTKTEPRSSEIHF